MGPTESFGTAELFDLVAPVVVGVVLAIVGLAIWATTAFVLPPSK